MPGVIALAGVVLVSAGILSLARGRKADLGSTLAALITGVFIACYTVCDGIGARVAGNANAYSAWLFMLDGLPMVLLYRVWKGPLNIDLRDTDTLKTFGGGVVSLVAYGIVIWAVTLAPMGPVSALRETSVVFAALLGRFFLKESLTARRLLPWAPGVSTALMQRVQAARGGYLTAKMSICSTPAGVRSGTVSPSRALMSARAIGEIQLT